MARFSKKKLLGTIILVLIVVVVGGYFITRSSDESVAESADSTAVDSTEVAEGEEAEDEDEEKGPDPVPVEVSTVLPREISSYYYTTATLEPERKVDILAKVAGQVSALHVEEGDIVRAGDILCQIEDEEPKVALEEARINKEQQKREYDRLKSMAEQNLISDTEFSNQQYQHELAETRYEAARLKYEYTKIRAPFDGVVTKRHVELGQNLSIGGQTFQIADTDPLLIRMYLPESEIRDIEVGQAVSIRPDNDPNQSLTGHIIRIAPEVDERTGTVKVTAETRGRAMPGSFARIKIVTDTRKGSLTIPRRGLVPEAGELYVYLCEADSVRKAPIVVGYQDEEFAEVLDGIQEGDSIVVVGIGGLRTGTKIRILDPHMQNALSREDEETDSISASNQ